MNYQPDPSASARGEFKLLNGELVWSQNHDALMRAAISTWKAAAADLTLHAEDELSGGPAPASGSGKRMRAQARALLWELSFHARKSPSLYRGSHVAPRGLEPWTSSRAVAERWAKKNGGQVYELTRGSRALRVSDWWGTDPEREWIAIT